MGAIMGTLFETDWGVIIIGMIIFIAIVISFFENKPKT